MAPAHGTDGESLTSQGVLIIGGVREDGKREIRAVDVVDTESAATYQELFRQLKARGLTGVELVTSDEHRGLVTAIKRTRVVRIFPNREACLRLVTALCAEQSDEWISGMRYLDIGELRRRRQEQEGKEVKLTAV